MTNNAQKISPITASYFCDGSEKSDVFRLLNMIHAMAGDSTVTGARSWQLSKTATQENYVLTEWTNGIVNVGAETFKDYGGEPTSHHYYLRPVQTEDETNA